MPRGRKKQTNKQKKKRCATRLTFIEQCKTIFLILPTWDLELRCLMNWKDFKCSWIIKSLERWRAEWSGRRGRAADQEDLPVCYQWGEGGKKRLPRIAPRGYKLRICSHIIFHSSPSTVLWKSMQHKHALHIHFTEWFMHERQSYVPAFSDTKL